MGAVLRHTRVVFPGNLGCVLFTLSCSFVFIAIPPNYTYNFHTKSRKFAIMPSEDRAREVADALGCLKAANLGAFAEEIELREMVEE